MKRKSMKQMLTMLAMVVAAFLFVQDAQAQSFTANEVDPLVGPKSTLFDNVVFQSNDDATLQLKAEIQNIMTNVSQENGGSVEAAADITVRFYSSILEDVQVGDSVEDAIKDNYNVVLSAKRNVTVPVNTQAILESAITLLSL